MNYMDWPTGSVAYYGPCGGLIPIPIAATSELGTKSSGARWATRNALSGRRVAQRLPRQRRDWDVQLPPMTEDELGSLQGLSTARYTGMACHWITPDMRNLVPPDWGTFDPWLTGNTDLSRGGPMVADGVFLPGHGISTSPNSQPIATGIPVIPGQPVTASCWGVAGGALPHLGVQVCSGAGTSLHWRQVEFPDLGLNRVSVTVEIPNGAAYCNLIAARVSLVGGQQVEWGDKMTPYSIPSGCQSAVMQEWSQELYAMEGDNPWWSYSFSVEEVR